MKVLSFVAATAITLCVFAVVIALASALAPWLLRLVEERPRWFLFPAIVVAPMTAFALTRQRMLRVRNQTQ